MTYDVDIEVEYTAGGETVSEPARRALAAAVAAALRPTGHEVRRLEVAVHAGVVVTVTAQLRGADPGRLTSPLEAVTVVDRALAEALTRTGLYEEFDVARRILRAAPAAPAAPVAP